MISRPKLQNIGLFFNSDISKKVSYLSQYSCPGNTTVTLTPGIPACSSTLWEQ